MNVLQPNKKTAIITLLTNGVSQREIGRKVRVDRKTIRKYARITEGNVPVTGSLSKSPGVATGSEDSSSQNPPPRPPALKGSADEEESMPAHARSACEEHRPWIPRNILMLMLLLQ